MAEKQVYLITGANRGLGHALVSHLVLGQNCIVIASTRHASIPESLANLPTHPSSSIVHLSARDANRDDIPADTDKILALLTGHPQIDHIDVVIANAGTTGVRQSILETSADNLLECLQVNALAPLKLLQTTWPLLQRAKSPKFMFIGSIAGSVSGVDETGAWSNAAYGVSKAAGNYLVRKAGKELEGRLAVGVIHPGWVQSETGNERAVKQGLEKAPVTLDISARGILEEIAHMAPGKDAGFRTFDHCDISW
ncbi:hypothetical protein B0I35DRAFT_441683 [Stachybotrys elegans]|uniref:Uncharacterized protein n=1 Tax=Stachybotrys elegans TaxID=80388 RepID=A0A8K0SJE8_9HYPO|nr:hypothetical protein B0I35DRAFT_441683 [Stachybotrys elegans]